MTTNEQAGGESRDLDLSQFEGMDREALIAEVKRLREETQCSAQEKGSREYCSCAVCRSFVHLRDENARQAERIAELERERERLATLERNKWGVWWNARHFAWVVQDAGQVCGVLGKGETPRAAIDDAAMQTNPAP